MCVYIPCYSLQCQQQCRHHTISSGNVLGGFRSVWHDVLSSQPTSLCLASCTNHWWYQVDSVLEKRESTTNGETGEMIEKLILPWKPECTYNNMVYGTIRCIVWYIIVPFIAVVLQVGHTRDSHLLCSFRGCATVCATVCRLRVEFALNLRHQIDLYITKQIQW